MSRLLVLLIANLVMGVVSVALSVAAVAKKQQVQVIAEHTLAPSQEYVRRMSESFVAALETVNPSNAERSDAVLSCVSGELYQRLKSIISKRTQIITESEAAQFVRVSRSECRAPGDRGDFECAVEGEKVIAFGEGVNYRAATVYRLVWAVSPPSSLNPLGLTLIDFDSEEKYENAK